MTFSNQFRSFIRHQANLSQNYNLIKYIFPKINRTSKCITQSTIFTRNINTSHSKINNYQKGIAGQKNFENSNNTFKNVLIVSITSLLIGAEIYRRSKLTVYASENNSKKRIIYEPTRKVN